MYAMYLRKSRDDLDIDIDLLFKNHYTMLSELAKRMNIAIDKENIFKEVVSGDSIAMRPEMQKLLNLVSEGYYEGVFCTELSRLCRGSKIDQEIVSTTFTAGECKIITPSKTYDLANNEFDEEAVDFGLFMSRREYKNITKRMQRGREQSVKNGKYIGSILPYGYNKEKLQDENGFKLVINEEEAHIIRLIYKWFLEDDVGASIIANRLNDRGYISRNGTKWTYAKVKNVLTSVVVSGYLSHNERKYKKYIDSKGNIRKSRPVNPDAEYFKGLHEAIISKSDFDEVQKRLGEKKHHRAPKDQPLRNPLSTIVICSVCGRNLVRRPYPTGRDDQLMCPTPKCENISSYLDRVENSILEGLNQTLIDYKAYADNYEEEYIKEKRNADNDLKRIDKEINKLNEQFSKCCDFLEIGTYSLELFNERTAIIKEKLSILNANKKVIEKELKNDKVVKIKKMIPRLENVMKNYNKLSVEGKNELLKSVIEKVVYTKTEKCKKGSEDDKYNLDIILKL